MPMTLGFFGIILFIGTIVSVVIWNDSYVKNSGVAQAGVFGILFGLILIFFGHIARWDFKRTYCSCCNQKAVIKERNFTGNLRAINYELTLSCPKCGREWKLLEANPH